MTLNDVYNEQYARFNGVVAALQKACEIEKTFDEFAIGGVRFTAVVSRKDSGVKEFATATFGSLKSLCLSGSGIYPEKLCWEPVAPLPTSVEAPVSRAVCLDVREPFFAVVIYRYEMTLLRARAKVNTNGEPA